MFEHFFMTTGANTASAWFLSVLNLSISASYLILAVIAVRFLFRKAPKNMRCILWLLVGMRLLCPFSMESVFSLLPDSTVIDHTITSDSSPNIDTGISQIDVPVNQYLQTHFTPEKSESVNPLQTLTIIAANIWLIGMIVMMIYLICSLIAMRRRVQTAVPFRDDKENIGQTIYQCDTINTPFLFGLLHPRIYVPYGIEASDLSYIICHENAHRQRRDYVTKLIAYLILTVYWFHPFIWVAYILLCKDIELACDEQVIRKLGEDSRIRYSEALLACAINQKRFAACPLAFGEIGVKERIKNILRYQKPGFWVIILAVIVCLILCVCFMTKPKETIEGKTIQLQNPAATQQDTETGTIQKQDDLKASESDSTLQETTISHTDIAGFIQEWAIAFTNRDGNKISAMSSKELNIRLEEDGLLLEGQDASGVNYTALGWSSPWPWGSEEVGEIPNYRIIQITENTANILYYAHVSDPHVTVWHEQLQFQSINDTYVITEETLNFMEYICTAEEFYTAYPDGMINGTPMDYLQGTTGVYLNQNAKANSDMWAYESLFAPDTAAVYLLNMLNNPEKVEAVVTETGEKDKVDVTFLFHENGTQANVTMIQPYGEDGIWIPQTAE